MTTCDECGTAIPKSLVKYTDNRADGGEVETERISCNYCPYCGTNLYGDE